MEPGPEKKIRKPSPPLSRCGRTEEEIQRIEGHIKISQGATDRNRPVLPRNGTPGPGDKIILKHSDGTRTIITIR